MPRTPRLDTRTKAPKPTAFVASAARVRPRDRAKGKRATGWQTQLWDLLDECGELEFYRQWKASGLRRCTLSVVEEYVDPDDGLPKTRPTTDRTALAAMDDLFSGENGMHEMLDTWGSHLAIAGESWLVGLFDHPGTPDAPDRWRALSSEEIKASASGGWVIDQGDGREEYTADAVTVTRIWVPSPRRQAEAYTPLRSLTSIIRRIVRIGAATDALLASYLSGAGILLVPTEMTFASPQGNHDSGEDELVQELIEIAGEAILDPESPASRVPAVLRGPASALPSVRHIAFSSPIDAQLDSLLERQIKRLATGLDAPEEILTGLADVNHWTGWLIDDQSVKVHIEVPLERIAHGLTVGYLWPMLQGDAEAFDPAIRRFRVVGDTSALRTKPDRSADVRELHQQMVVTNAALVREVGLQDGDLLDPDSEEYRQRMATRAGVGEPAPAAAPEPVNRPPERQAALMAACEPLVLRAVRVGWARAGGSRKTQRRTPVGADAAAEALAGVWDTWGSQNPITRTAALLGVDPTALEAAVGGEAARLLASGEPYDAVRMAAVLGRL